MVVPEYLTCPISLQIMTDPVTLSSGHSYEKAEIIRYFDKHGYSDPISREEVRKEMIENINLRQAIEEFMEKNPWCLDHTAEE